MRPENQGPDIRSLTIQRFVRVTLLMIVLVIGLAARLDRLPHWMNHRGRFFINELKTPVMLGVDSYYYMDIAKQITAGSYSPIDARRRVPDGYVRPHGVPLLSIILAGAHQLAGVSLDWAALLISPFLGTLVALPSFLLGHALARRLGHGAGSSSVESDSGAWVMGLLTAFFAVTSPYLVKRSAVGWCDTDSLNVAFAMCAAVCALCGTPPSSLRSRIAWLGAGVATLVLFWRWWDQAAIVVLFLAGSPLIASMIATLTAFRHRLCWGLAMIGVVLIVALLQLGSDWNDPSFYRSALLPIAQVIPRLGLEESAFFQSGTEVSEQIGFMPFELAHAVAGVSWLGLAGIVAFLVLLAVAGRRLSPMVPLMAVAAMALIGRRFAIFVSPLYALGLGFVGLTIWRRIGNRGVRHATLLLMVVAGAVAAGGGVREDQRQGPRRPPRLLQGMVDLQETVPGNAVIWTSWGNGHPLIYYADRATMADGIYHPASSQYLLNYPLGDSDPRLAANWISFCVAHGISGCREANAMFGDGAEDWADGMRHLQGFLRVGPEESRRLLEGDPRFSAGKIDSLIRYIFPGNARPIFLFIDYGMLETGAVSLGWWDFDARAFPPDRFMFSFYDITPGEGMDLKGRSSRGDVLLSLEDGSLRFSDQEMSLSRISIYGGGPSKVHEYAERGDGVAIVSAPPFRIGLCSDERSSESVIVKLFFDLYAAPSRFIPVLSDMPFFAVWRVVGDELDSKTDHSSS